MEVPTSEKSTEKKTSDKIYDSFICHARQACVTCLKLDVVDFVLSIFGWSTTKNIKRVSLEDTAM